MTKLASITLAAILSSIHAMVPRATNIGSTSTRLVRVVFSVLIRSFEL